MDAGGRGSHHGIAYRPEIDGLRAIAVLIVILYHGQIPGFAGGFIGVDLFFVISGYLITGIIAGDLAAGNFSIARFYERRIRRIIPALMLVMLLCVPFALWLMLPDDLENFGQSLVGTTAFANNILLLYTSGYFATEVQFKPLMHTWSLGVEEQYYLVVPLLMWVAWRLGKTRGLVIGIAVVTLLSFAVCIAYRYIDPRYGFFLITSRGWELGAGSLAFFLEPRLRPLANRRTAAMLAIAGLALAAFPLLQRNPVAAPGVLTAIPVAGLCLILLFATPKDPAGHLLSSKPFVAVGLVSYSAYLFHQPLFAFTRIVSLEPPPQWLMLALLVPTFLLAWLSWRFVEQPCRDRRRVSTRAVLAGSVAAGLVAVAAGLTFHMSSGFYRSWPQFDQDVAAGGGANIAYNLGPDRFRQVRLPASGDKVRVLVLGNSFARDFINMAIETGRLRNHVLAFIDTADCPELPAEVIEQARRAQFIILSTRFRAGHVKCIADRVARLRGQTSARIIVIGRKSFGYNNNAVMLLPPAERLAWRAEPSPEALRANERAKRTFPPAIYVDMIGLLGDARGRVPALTPGGKFISQDREHLTRSGAIYVGGIVFRHPALAAMLDAGRPQPDPHGTAK